VTRGTVFGHDIVQLRAVGKIVIVLDTVTTGCLSKTLQQYCHYFVSKICSSCSF